MTVTTPDVGSATQLPVTVSTTGVAGGTSAVVPAGEYTFVSPQVTLVVPGKGPTSGGGQVTVTGSDFSGATTVRFGSTPSVVLLGPRPRHRWWPRFPPGRRAVVWWT